jgi:hypothetical protein
MDAMSMPHVAIHCSDLLDLDLGDSLLALVALLAGKGGSSWPKFNCFIEPSCELGKKTLAIIF